MNYHILSKSSEQKEIGQVFPQIQTVGGTINVKAPNSMYNVFHNILPDFIPNLDYLILHPKAKLTDFLSCALIDSGFIISEKVKQILEQTNLMEHKFFPAKIKQGEIMHENYYWFFFVGDLTKFIDFHRTEFFICDFFGDKVIDCNISNELELKESINKLLEQNKRIATNRIVFESNFDNQFDLFSINYFNFDVFISKKILTKFSENLVSGIDIKNQNMI